MSSYGCEFYKHIDRETKVDVTNPYEIILLLFDSICNAISRAKIYFSEGNIGKRGEMLSRAIVLIDKGLRLSLNHEIDTILSGDLDRLYEYISRTLLMANIKDDIDMLEHAELLIMNIYEAWREVGDIIRSKNG